MLRQISPRLGRFDVVSNSFTSCISNTPKEFSWTPEMSSSKMVSQPRMFSKKFKGRISFKQLKCLANTNCSRQFNKQVDMVNSNMQLINFEAMPASNLPYEKLTINPDKLKLEGVSCIFRFPDKMESILSEAVFKTFQIHFFTPKLAQEDIAHANFNNLVQEGSIHPLDINRNQELNFMEDGNSSLCLKAQVSLPLM